VDDVLAGLEGELASAVVGRITDGTRGVITVSGNIA
jgi:hypothetical protein